MQVRIAQGQLKYFRQKARQGFPKEIVAFMLGRRVLPHRVEIYKLIYPAIEISTELMVRVAVGEVERISALADSQGLKVVGTIHTHPEGVPVLSPCDYAGFRDELIAGVMAIIKKNFAWMLHFWVADKSLPCKWEYL